MIRLNTSTRSAVFIDSGEKGGTGTESSYSSVGYNTSVFLGDSADNIKQ